jgi:hypothetical protein
LKNRALPFSILFILFISFFSVTSCNRKEFKGYKGTYACNKAVTTWTAGEPTEHIVTSAHFIEVEKEKKSIIVQGHSVHIDSIAPDTDYSFTRDALEYTIRFSEDWILYQEVDTSGGNGTRVQYVCVKE